jgi:hypothetical protein
MESRLNFEDISIAPGVKETASADGAVLLDIAQGVCFSLNPVGLKIWDMLKQHYPIEQIADSLQQEFYTPRPELMVDIRSFLTELEAKHLILHGVHATAKQGLLAKLFAGRRRDFRT